MTGKTILILLKVRHYNLKYLKHFIIKTTALQTSFLIKLTTCNWPQAAGRVILLKLLSGSLLTT